MRLSFICRDCISQPGDYVLTCKWNGQVIHVIIQKVNKRLLWNAYLYHFSQLYFPNLELSRINTWKERKKKKDRKEEKKYPSIHLLWKTS